MKGWILYSKRQDELTASDNGVTRLLAAAKLKNISLDVYQPEQFDLTVTRADKKSILIDNTSVALPDFIIPRLGAVHTSYFALAVIRQLEYLGVYICNRSSAIEIVKDKLRMHQILAQNNFPTPKTMLVKFPIDINIVKSEIGFPVIIKNITGAKGSGIYLCESEHQFLDLMELIYINNNSANIIIQEFIQQSHGRDLRVFVLGDQVIGCMKRYSETSFKANFSRGGLVEAFELDARTQQLAIQTAHLVGLEIAGIDLLFTDNGFSVCEANSSPGFKGLELVVGNTIAEKILDYIVDKVAHLKA